MHPKAKSILEEITSGHKKKEDIDPAHTLEDVEDFINYDLTHVCLQFVLHISCLFTLLIFEINFLFTFFLQDKWLFQLRMLKNT